LLPFDSKRAQLATKSTRVIGIFDGSLWLFVAAKNNIGPFRVVIDPRALPAARRFFASLATSARIPQGLRARGIRIDNGVD
jgi:hypothetical protein